MDNFYSILGISSADDLAAVRKAYYSTLSETFDTELLNQLHLAYSTLSDQEKRAAYDIELQNKKDEEEYLLQQEIAEKQSREIENRKKYSHRVQEAELNYKDLLSPYIGKSIGINLIDPSKFQQCVLSNANIDFFSVRHGEILTHIPYQHLLRVTQSTNGGMVKTGSILGFQAAIFIEVFHMVIYKGAVGFGISI